MLIWIKFRKTIVRKINSLRSRNKWARWAHKEVKSRYKSNNTKCKNILSALLNQTKRKRAKRVRNKCCKFESMKIKQTTPDSIVFSALLRKTLNFFLTNDVQNISISVLWLLLQQNYPFLYLLRISFIFNRILRSLGNHPLLLYLAEQTLLFPVLRQSSAFPPMSHSLLLQHSNLTIFQWSIHILLQELSQWILFIPWLRFLIGIFIQHA